MIRDQAERLRRKLAAANHPKTARTIAVASGKGGVGKSNLALNMSLELIKHDKRVLLFDLDVGMGNIDILLGMDVDQTIVDMFAERLPIDEMIQIGPRGLAYIAAGSGLNDLFTMEPDNREYFFQQYEALVDLYDYIIFDMGAGVTLDSLSFILASDECIIVTTPEPTSITDAYGMIKHIVNNHPELPISVVMNRAPSVIKGERALERFRRVIMQFLKVDVRKLGILPDDQVVSDAVIRQTPYILLNGKTAVSIATKQIAANILSEASIPRKQPSVSFVQKLKKLMLKR
ncbi:MinD/ParA family protein [Lentibacillus cibarius]|uniref:MinD/ParA family protein n=1 Tax=Lentibacillus cibarius TaxID=2583219 RepID=A0A5S3QP97_9BACI|nr:MinD/ParA family protein [Lentibacillus cibarius]TMN23595.1 MinD/ParA family protein [Lentibacillus cibarius]